MENKFKIGDYVRVDWTDSILKIQEWNKSGKFYWFDENDQCYWYHCEKSEFNPYETSYYCNTAEDDVIEMATEKEFYLARKESLEYAIEGHKRAIKSFEDDIKEIEKYLR